MKKRRFIHLGNVAKVSLVQIISALSCGTVYPTFRFSPYRIPLHALNQYRMFSPRYTYTAVSAVWYLSISYPPNATFNLLWWLCVCVFSTLVCIAREAYGHFWILLSICLLLISSLRCPWSCNFLLWYLCKINTASRMFVYLAHCA